jgi:replicative superfamily II helicase
MVFKKINRSGPSNESPEALLHDLRGKKIQGPLAHQADIWRIYVEKHLHSSDLAIEMPTGSGKTLVGLILAEWRRRLNKEKVVYLCPTNQLVYQVAEQSEKKYGLKVASFTGKVNTYSAESKSEYQMAEKIAVTSYSALFNSNPYFSDPDLIILDDAHASENYISKLWSLEIENDHSNNGPLFIRICGLLKGEITESCHLRLTQKDSQANDPFWVEKLPTPVFHKISKDLIELLSSS